MERHDYAKTAVDERRARLQCEADQRKATAGDGAGLALLLAGAGLITWGLIRQRGPDAPMVGAGAAGVVLGAGLVLRF